MSFLKAVYLLLINLILLLQCPRHFTQAYTQVSTSGSNSGDEGPKIFKAVNFDLIFPKSFNSSENVISTTPESIPSSSETAVNVGQQYYPLPQSNEQINIADDNQQQPQHKEEQQQQQHQPLYVTPPTSNEAGSYDTNRQQNTNQDNSNNNIYDNAQVVTQNPINIQQQLQQLQQQQQLNDNNKAVKEQQKQQQQQQLNLATGRAVDYHTGYPFGQLITPLIKNAPRPVYKKPPSSSSSLSNVGKIIYPQAVYQQKPPSQAEIDKLRGKGSFRDRFAPSEGVASHQIKSNNHNHHNHAPTYNAVGKTPSASNVVNSYVAPNNLFSFPPNNVNYPKQTQGNKVALPSGVISSYSPPASGPFKNTNTNLATASTNDNPYQYPGPLSTAYGPPSTPDNGANDAKDNGGGGDGGDGDLDNGGGDDSVGVLPASAMDGNGDNNGDMGGDNNGGDMGDTAASMDSADDHDHSHDHHHDDHSYDTEKEYPTPPPGWLDDHPQHDHDHPHHDHHPDTPDIELDHDHDHHHHHPDIEFDHDHDHHHHPDIVLDHDPHSHHFDFHDSYPSFPSYPSYHHSYPELIYDDHHDHHVEHVEPPPPPPTTTEAPLPEPPPEPRVKKYSYFYIGRKLWYIPLYFTVWFSFYVLWLILKSIARHKVNLPNHYVNRRSVDNYDFSKTQQETINQLTVSVMDKIENFKKKYLN